MNLTDKIYIAGHTGLVGSAILRLLRRMGYMNIVTRSSMELDLTNQKAVSDFFFSERPQFVFLAAAKVGGIMANNTYPAEFIYDNLAIQTNVIHAAHHFGVEKLLFLGSSCIYPKNSPQPINEGYLLTSPLEPTNAPYAIAKIAGINMCQSYHRQYGSRFISVMPCNLYGPGGNNHSLQNSHVIPAMICKFHTAKKNVDSEVYLWGTGTPKRELLYVDDAAKAIVHLMKIYESPEIINVGCGNDYTIKEIANIIRHEIGYKGKIIFDDSKPDGTMRKLLDVQKINNLGWYPEVEIIEGIKRTVKDYLNHIK